MADSFHATDLKAACLKFAAKNLAEVMRSNGFEYLKEKCPLLQLELLKTIAGFDDYCSSGESSGESCTSVCAQIKGDADPNVAE